MKKRRKAIDCKLVGESKSSPGYFKYEITIEEKNGEIHKKPAYGKDMEDAIARLVWVEKSEKVGKNNFKLAIFVMTWLTTIIVPSIVASIQKDPFWVIVSLIISVVIGFSLVRINNYLHKS